MSIHDSRCIITTHQSHRLREHKLSASGVLLARFLKWSCKCLGSICKHLMTVLLLCHLLAYSFFIKRVLACALGQASCGLNPSTAAAAAARMMTHVSTSVPSLYLAADQLRDVAHSCRVLCLRERERARTGISSVAALTMRQAQMQSTMF